MSDIEERQQDVASEVQVALNDQQIGQYLLQNPDFFIRNAQMIENMHVPHPVRGSISLVEWHMVRQRGRIRELEEEITLLMEQASANEALFSRLLMLQGDLAAADNLQDLLLRLHRWARSFGLASADIRLFSDQWRIDTFADFTHLALARNDFEPLRIQRMGSQNHYLGSLNEPEMLMLLPQAKQVGSVALSLMGKIGELGVVIFSSRDHKHYHSGMGTTLLEQLALLLPPLLERWIERQ